MLRNMNDLLDYAIRATDGDIGHVKDFYFDDASWVIRYLVVDTGTWLAQRKVLISPVAIGRPDRTSRVFPAAITKEQVTNSPDVDTDKPVSRQYEELLHDYYGYPYYWGGAGIWGMGAYPEPLQAGMGGFGNLVSSEPIAPPELQEAYASVEAAERARADPHLQNCNAVIGYHIHAEDGDIGHVQGLLVDEDTWAIRYIIVDTGNWWAGHQVLVSPEWIRDLSWPDSELLVDLTRQQIKDAPAYDPEVPFDRELEEGIHAHYGRPGYWAGSSKTWDDERLR